MSSLHSSYTKILSQLHSIEPQDNFFITNPFLNLLRSSYLQRHIIVVFFKYRLQLA